MLLSLFSSAPECFHGNHRLLSDPQRSVDFDSTVIQNTNIQELICDSSLQAGWYRFRIGGRPAEMPTSCVEVRLQNIWSITLTPTLTLYLTLTLQRCPLAVWR